MPFATRLANILVVAPDDSLRRSLCFVLRAEGYSVRDLPRWPAAANTPAFDAAVIDHGGIGREAVNDLVLNGLGPRAIILSSHTEAPSHLTAATVVRKPLIGRELVERLQAVLFDHATPSKPN